MGILQNPEDLFNPDFVCRLWTNFLIDLSPQTLQLYDKNEGVITKDKDVKKTPNSNTATRRIGNMVRVLQREIRFWVGPYLFLAVAAFLTPVGYLLYVLFVRWFQGDPLIITSLLSLEMLLYFLVMALTGTITSLNWVWGFVLQAISLLLGSWSGRGPTPPSPSGVPDTSRFC